MPYNFDEGCLKEPSEPYRPSREYPKFLQVDRRIAEVNTEIEYMEKMLKSKRDYLKQLIACRKIVTPTDEAKIQALISAGLL